MRKTLLTAFLATGILSYSEVKAQGFLKKLKEKAEQAVEKKADQAIEKKTGISSTSSSDNSGNSSNSTTSSSSNSGSGKPSNKGGGGLTNTTPPDVAQQIVDAEQAYNSSNFSDARYAVQQALMGVEIQLGRQILKSLPQTISGLPSDSTGDKVMSTSWGWSNLTIQKIYRKDDKEFNVTVGNTPMYSGLINIYFSGVYSTTANAESQNVKQIRVKGNKAIIKYDDNEGYTVLVPLGQSGMVALNGINFANEQEMMTAVNTIDVESIKKLLGEK